MEGNYPGERAQGKPDKRESAMGELGFLHILNDGFFASLPLLIPFIQKDIPMEFGKIGFLTGLLNSAGIALALPAASLAAAMGGRRLLVFAAFLYSAAFIVTGLAGSYAVLMIAFIVASLGFGVFHPVSFALIANESRDEELGNRMGNFTAIGDIGKLGISACVTFLVSVLAWRGAALAYGAIPLAAIASLSLFRRPATAPAPARPHGSAKARGLRRSARYRVAVTACFLDTFASSSLFAFIPFLFVHRGAPPALLGALSGAFFVGNMLGKKVIGQITDRFGCRNVFIVSEIAMAILLVVLSVLERSAAIALVSVLVGAVTKGTVPVINTLVAQSVPDRSLNERAFGFVSTVGGIAAFAAPIAFGFLAQRAGILSVFWGSAVFALLATIPILAGWEASLPAKR